MTSSIIDLPAEIGLVSIRDLAWSRGELVHRDRLNVLVVEAPAAAHQVGAPICVGFGNRSPRLEAAAASERAGFRVIEG